MTLRAKLVLAFLLLAVLPLTGLVALSYRSSVRALRGAVEEESRQLTAEIERNLDRTRDDLLQRFREIQAVARLAPPASAAPPEVPAAPEVPDEQQMMAVVEESVGAALSSLGDAGEWFRSFAVTPLDDETDVETDAETDSAAPSGLVFYRGEGGAPEARPEPRGGVRRQLETSPWRRRKLTQVTRKLERQLQRVSADLEQKREVARQSETAVARGAGDLHRAIDDAVDAGLLEAEQERLVAQRSHLEHTLGKGFTAIIEGVGRFDAEVDVGLFFRRVLAATRRENGEVPFAVSAAGELFVSSEDDKQQLLALTDGDIDQLKQFLPACGPYAERAGWVLATRSEPESELVFGIARPISDSLAEVRRATGRNLLLGVGMIGLSLLGILPLSGRLTRGLKQLAADADHLAGGDLDARASVSGRDELGQLGIAFNHMAAQLQEQRELLVEEGRRSREREVERRLLEVENQRRGEELEEARRFQLSMLPERLPEHDLFEIAVFMRTATEVGGDYYDFRCQGRREQRRWRCTGPMTTAIGDATGHGARAGTMVTVIKTLFASRGAEEPLCDFLRAATGSIKGMNLGRMAMALQLVRFDETGFEVASAGMPPPLVRRSGSAAVEEVELPGLPLGAMADADYRSRRVAFSTGDTVLLMSDGFPELVEERGEGSGYGVIRDLFAELGDRSPDEMVTALEAEVERCSGSGAPSDDVTFVVVRRR